MVQQALLVAVELQVCWDPRDSLVRPVLVALKVALERLVPVVPLVQQVRQVLTGL